MLPATPSGASPLVVMQTAGAGGVGGASARRGRGEAVADTADVCGTLGAGGRCVAWVAPHVDRIRQRVHLRTCLVRNHPH
eukprot:563872-Prymnesium_polylepis.1